MESLLWVAVWAAEACFSWPAPLLLAFTSLYPLRQVNLYYVWMDVKGPNREHICVCIVWPLEKTNAYIFSVIGPIRLQQHPLMKMDSGIRIQLELTTTGKKSKYLLLLWTQAFWQMCVSIMIKRQFCWFLVWISQLSFNSVPTIILPPRVSSFNSLYRIWYCLNYV